MKYQPILLLFFIGILLFSTGCKNDPDPNLNTSPCKGIVADTTGMSFLWSQPNAPYSVTPILYQNKVLCVTGTSAQSHLVCYDGLSGQLIWDKAVPTEINYSTILVEGDVLYFVANQNFNALNLSTQEIKTVYTLPNGSFEHKFSIINNQALCRYNVFNNPMNPGSDTVTSTVGLIDLSSGGFRQLYHSGLNYLANDFISYPILSVLPSGDSVLHFVENKGLDGNGIVSHDYVWFNTHTHEIKRHSIKNGSYNDPKREVHLLRNDFTYLTSNDSVYCFSANSGDVVWKRNLPNTELRLFNDQLIAAHTYLIDFFRLDPMSGNTVWQNDNFTYNASSVSIRSSFAINNMMYFAGTEPDAKYNYFFRMFQLDLSTGCILGKHSLPAVSNGGNKDILTPFTGTADGKTFYFFNTAAVFGVQLK
jgi:outer membrane protein assembly factor BamB